MMASRTETIADDALATRYRVTRAESVRRAVGLSDADATVQSMPDASPAKWHLAHTTWFFETFVLRDHVECYAVFDPTFHFLFNSYYDGEGDRHARPRRGLLTRPSLDTILDYRSHVDAALEDALPMLPDNARALIELGCHHEAQHQELLLTDILHLFAQNPLRPAYRDAGPVASAAVRPMAWIKGRTGIVEVGCDGDDFAFDCEGPRHPVFLTPHVIADSLVTNGEWADFIADGGYRRPELWLSDGWAWRTAAGVEAPLYWEDDMAFSLNGIQRRDTDAPVCHVSHYEADAYARWADARLPTEGEWEAAAANRAFDDGFGTVWQWTGSAYLPYPGFKPAAGAVGEYNGKFMSGQIVLRGSSHATPVDTSRVTTRNFFPPATRWQFAGVRLARDL